MSASNSFYSITSAIKNYLLSNGVTNQVTYGSLADVDLNKQSIFPVTHIQVESAQLEERVVRYSITVLAMDIVYDRKEAMESDADGDNMFTGLDNEQDVLNTQLWVVNNLTRQLLRGQLRTDGYELANTPTAEPFTDRFHSKVAGWAITYEILTANDLCVTSVDSVGRIVVARLLTAAEFAGITPDANTYYLNSASVNAGELTSGAADASVSNSDDSYDVTVASGGSLELPDIDITVTDSLDHGLGTKTVATDLNNPAAVDQTVVINPARGAVYWMNQTTYDGLTPVTDATYIIDDDLANDVIETNYDAWPV